jgi:hypothetical protein
VNASSAESGRLAHQHLARTVAGPVKRINCKVGDIVQEGVERVEIEPRNRPYGVISNAPRWRR